MSVAKQACASCAYAVGVRGLSECRRYPPISATEEDVYPLIRLDGLCGEYSRRPPERPTDEKEW